MMESVERVDIKLPQLQYTVLIGSGLLKGAGEHLRELSSGYTSTFVITSAPIRKLWGEALTQGLKGMDPVFLEVPDGERYKTFKIVEELARKMVKRGADRKAVVV